MSETSPGNGKKLLMLNLPGKKYLKYVGNILLLVGTVTTILLLLEFFVRVSGLQPMNPIPQIHQRSSIPGLFYDLKPNMKNVDGFGHESVSTDSSGFRSPEPDRRKPTIVFLGDSMAYGYGVENNEANPLVAGKHFSGYNVINAGVSSYNIEQATITYDSKVAGFNPELVVLEFVINDAEPKSDLSPEAGKPTEEQKKLFDERLRSAITKPGLINFPGKFFLHKHSALFTFIERSTKALPFRKHAEIVSNEWSDADLLFYDRWLTRLSRTIGNRKKLFVLWPDGAIYPKTKYAVQKMAADNGWLVLDLSDLFGNHYKTLVWDLHPRASEQKRAGELIAEVILKYELLR